MFDSVDDTKIVGKAVIGELAENLEEMFHNKYCVRYNFFYGWAIYLFGRISEPLKSRIPDIRPEKRFF